MLYLDLEEHIFLIFNIRYAYICFLFVTRQLAY